MTGISGSAFRIRLSRRMGNGKRPGSRQRCKRMERLSGKCKRKRWRLERLLERGRRRRNKARILEQKKTRIITVHQCRRSRMFTGVCSQ